MNEQRFDELSDEFERIVEEGERIDPPDELEEEA